ncbi:MAG: GYD domain-containing protein [Desulfuromonadales bacterium]|nr:GYD domain-containing protein [Desulfuromonadales bacterium]
MAKYLAQISYTIEGAKGLIKDGGTKRHDVVEKLTKELNPSEEMHLPLTMSYCSMEAVKQHVTGVGGALESFYYAFGDFDLIVIMDLPDNASAAAFSLAISASGASKIKTTVLLSPEEIDQASKMSHHYRPPGQQ